MKLARVIGTIWATRRIPHMEGATLQLIQPLAERRVTSVEAAQQANSLRALAGEHECDAGRGQLVGDRRGEDLLGQLPGGVVRVRQRIGGFAELGDQVVAARGGDGG